MGVESTLVMEDIRKTFPGVVALNNVRFELQRGEVHILLGENGAGKSTLIKLLGGALKKDAGRILLDGREVEIRGPHHAQELGIGIIYQELHLVPHLSAAENIFLGREPELFPGIIDQKILYAKAQEIIDGLHVDIDARAIVKTLSVAQQQMVEIAKAVSLDVRILVMDEPTSALTESEIEQLFAMIKRLKMTGVSIIYISHRLDEIFQVGDRVTVLLDGKYVGTYGIGELSRAELVRQMVNREIKEHFPKVRTPRGEEKLRVEHVVRAGELNDISFSLYGGEVLGVAGLLGSGRTELARVIFGLDPVDSGTISINGTVQTKLNPRRAVKLGLGYLTEDRKNQGLVLRLSVKENILLASLDRLAKFGVLDPATESAAAQRYVEDLRIKTPGLEQQVVNLSGGNQQKVVLSKWLCSEAQIFIFDEPTRGIDVGAKVEIYKLMNGLTERGAAVLMISSELPEILGMSDRIMVMREGTVAALLDAANATQEMILHHALGNQ
jgi:ribose transport system ATP-binding protein